MSENSGVGLHKFHCRLIILRKVWRYQSGNQKS